MKIIKSKKSAFSLIELSVVLVLLAVIIAASLSSRVVKIKNAESSKSIKQFEEVYKAMGRFAQINGRLPCPASLNKRRENGNGNGNGSNDFGSEVINNGDCSGLGIYLGGSSSQNLDLAYGMVPFKELRLGDKKAKDLYNNRLIYVVDKRMTKVGGFNDDSHIISVINKKTQSTKEFDFIIMNQGRNKAGAFSMTKSSQITKAGSSDEQSNAINQSALPTFDHEFISHSTDPGFDDKIFAKTRDDLIRDFNLGDFFSCAESEELTIANNVFTWPDAAAGAKVSSTQACPNNFKGKAMYAIRKCNEDGTWGDVVLTCEEEPIDFSDTVDAEIGLASGLDSVESNLMLWLDAKNIDENHNSTLANEAQISTWHDLSLNKNHAIQSGINKPIYKAGDYVYFNAGNYFVIPRFTTGLTEGEIFAVVKVDTESGKNGGFHRWGNSSNFLYNWDNGQIYENFGRNTRYAWNSPTDLNQFVIYNVSSKPSNWYARINGSQDQYRTNGVVSWGASNTIGDSQWGNWDGGSIQEIIFLSRVSTVSERVFINYYLSKKWNLASTVDSNNNGVVDSVEVASGEDPVKVTPCQGAEIDTTSVPGKTICIFRSSGGSFSITEAINVEYLIVAGGGGGGGDPTGSGQGGGGGAGGLLNGTKNMVSGNYNIIVGSGGGVRNNGANSSFDSLVAIGGGRGGGTGKGSTGGSGGGTGFFSFGYSGAVDGQGYRGGKGGNWVSGAGGGAGGVGGDGSNTNMNIYGGRGGNGKQFDITGINSWYAVGGPGISRSNVCGRAAPGGSSCKQSGASNTGNGGGWNKGGGSGIVVIRYDTPTDN